MILIDEIRHVRRQKARNSNGCARLRTGTVRVVIDCDVLSGGVGSRDWSGAKMSGAEEFL